jgi:uncharacterized protein (DUF1015 family)
MEVSPFRGIRYNQRIVGDLAQVICPPYDVITSEQQKLYYKRSDYNAIRLELPAESQEPTVDRYQRAAITFQQWLKQGVLQTDSVSSFYLHDHRFEYAGEERVRRGLIARVKLMPWGSGIYPHEETLPKAKSDRLQLLQACRANFSPLFSLYQDSERKIAPILAHIAEKEPLMSLQVPSAIESGISGRSNLLDSKEDHILWAITDTEIKRELGKLLFSLPFYIADGHHRYETALTYQQERAREQSDSIGFSVIATLNGVKKKQSLTGKEAFNYVITELVDFSDPGLVVLPVHRLVRGIAPSALTGLGKQLENFFTLEFVSFSEDSLARCHYEPFAFSAIATLNRVKRKQSRGVQDIVLGILGLYTEALVLLRHRQDVSIEAMMPGNRSRAYREFGVSILKHIILDKVLSGAEKLEVAYTVDLKEAYQQIKEGKYQLAFLLNPPQPEVIKAVADAQDRLPSKSTYFYPKVPAGLIINPLD